MGDNLMCLSPAMSGLDFAKVDGDPVVEIGVINDESQRAGTLKEETCSEVLEAILYSHPCI